VKKYDIYYSKKDAISQVIVKTIYMRIDRTYFPKMNPYQFANEITWAIKYIYKRTLLDIIHLKDIQAFHLNVKKDFSRGVGSAYQYEFIMQQVYTT
jgi:hypothetical protein